MVVFKKTVLEDGHEYLDATQFIDETDPRSFKLFSLAKVCEDVLNYFIENTPDAFGNAPYARLKGFMQGYLAGQGMDLVRGNDIWEIRKGKRIVMRIEVPQKPAGYYEALADNARTWRDVFG